MAKGDQLAGCPIDESIAWRMISMDWWSEMHKTYR